MSVLIKGMEMPTSCEDCPMGFSVNFGILCTPTHNIVGDGEISKKQGFCPLIPVPEHGRLIDADALTKSDRMVGKLMMFDGEYVYTQAEINRAPTIIPAEEA